MIAATKSVSKCVYPITLKQLADKAKSLAPTSFMRWFSISAFFVSVLVLSACGRGMCDMPGMGKELPGGGPTEVTIPLLIQDYGPRAVTAGLPFNRQADGLSAVWFRANQNLEGDIVDVHFNHIVLQGSITGDFVTLRVPDYLHATEGKISVYLSRVHGSRVTKSNVVTIVLSKQ